MTKPVRIYKIKNQKHFVYKVPSYPELNPPNPSPEELDPNDVPDYMPRCEKKGSKIEKFHHGLKKC